MEIHMDTPVQYLKGVGERRAQQFARLGVTTAGTLLRHYPRQYEDWSAIVPIASAPVGEPCCIRATACPLLGASSTARPDPYTVSLPRMG